VEAFTTKLQELPAVDNKWQGYFAEDRQGQKRVTTLRDGILTKNYYFRLPGDSKK